MSFIGHPVCGILLRQTEPTQAPSVAASGPWQNSAVREKPHDVPNQKYLLPGPLQKGCPDPRAEHHLPNSYLEAITQTERENISRPIRSRQQYSR